MWKSNFLAPMLAVPARIRITLAAVSISALAMAGGYFATAGDTISTDVFPDRLPVRAELHQGEDLRTVEFHADGITPRHALAHNSDGTTSHYNYRVDGTLETAETILTREDGTNVVIRHADIMADGVTYKYDVQYFEDGVRKFKENRLVDATTQHRQYFHDNGVVRADQTIVYDSKSYSKKGWKLFAESTYRPDASLVSTFKYLENDGSDRQYFSDKGVLTSWKKVTNYASNYEEVQFQPDGKTPIRVMKQDHQNTEVITYRPDGSMFENRKWYGPVESAMMTVITYDQKGIRVLSQSYMGATDKYRLWSINSFTADGKDDHRHISFTVGGAVTETVYFGDGSKWTNRYFGVDGFLQKETDMVAGQGAVATREYTAADNIRMDIPAEWLVMTKWELPPQIIPYVPAYMH